MVCRSWWSAGLVLTAACSDPPGVVGGETSSSEATDASSTTATATALADTTSGDTFASTSAPATTEGEDAGSTTLADTTTTGRDVTDEGSSTSDPTSGSTSSSESTGSSSGSDSSGSSGSSDTSSSDTSSSSSGSGDSESSESSSAQDDGGYCGALTSPGDTGAESTGSGETGEPSPCGNGELDPGEICDDGNQIGGDGCEPDCISSDDVQPIWTLDLGGPDGYVDCGTGVAFDCAGNLIVAAYTEPDVIWIRKYDADYVEQWTVTYPGVPGAAGCPIVRVATDLDGNVGFIGDIAPDDPSSTDVFIGLLDPSGAEIWTTTIMSAGVTASAAGDIAFDPFGNVLVTGTTLQPPAIYADLWVSKLDPTGAEAWSDFYDGPGGISDTGRGVAADSSGNVLVVGNSHNGSDQDIFVRKYDADGAVVWTDIVAGPEIGTAYDFATGVAALPQGDLVAVGTYKPPGAQRDGWLRRYTPEGDESWTGLYDGTAPDGDDGINGVAIGSNGTLLIAGRVIDASAVRWLARVGGDGGLIWERRIQEGGAWFAVATAPDGRVAVGGVVQLPFPWDAEARFAVYPP